MQLPSAFIVSSLGQPPSLRMRHGNDFSGSWSFLLPTLSPHFVVIFLKHKFDHVTPWSKYSNGSLFPGESLDHLTWHRRPNYCKVFAVPELAPLLVFWIFSHSQSWSKSVLPASPCKIQLILHISDLVTCPPRLSCSCFITACITLHCNYLLICL